MEARLKQEFSTAHHEWYLANHDRLVKKYTNDNADDWKKEYIFSLAAWNTAKAESAALHETIATLRADATKAAEELVRVREECEHWENRCLARIAEYREQCAHIGEIETELARERERHQWIDCKQELPVDRKAVLVWCPERMNKYTACWTGETWHHFGGHSNCYMIEEVTHWTPTPDPPASLEPQPAPPEEPR